MIPEKSLPFFQLKPEGLLLFLQVQPGANKSEWLGLTEDGYVKLRLNAPAEKGKANKALLDFLSETLGIRKSDIEIISGQRARKKRVLIKISNPGKILIQLNSFHK